MPPASPPKKKKPIPLFSPNKMADTLTRMYSAAGSIVCIMDQNGVVKIGYSGMSTRHFKKILATMFVDVAIDYED